MRDVTPLLSALFTLCLGLLVLAVSVAGAVYAVGTYRRAARVLSEWATHNGYRIIESDRKYLRKGPFTWTSSQSQIIYHVTVQDANGNTRRGWVRCGSFLFGPWEDVVDVRWEDT